MDKATKKYEGKPAKYSQEERWKLEAWMKLNSPAATATGGNPYVNRWNERPYTGDGTVLREPREASCAHRMAAESFSAPRQPDFQEKNLVQTDYKLEFL